MAVFEPEEKKKPFVPKHRGMWWGGKAHPLTDAQFIEAFCQHVLLTTDDRSLVTVRNRAFRFIRTIMAPAMEADLTKYREDYP